MEKFKKILYKKWLFLTVAILLIVFMGYFGIKAINSASKAAAERHYEEKMYEKARAEDKHKRKIYHYAKTASEKAEDAASKSEAAAESKSEAAEASSSEAAASSSSQAAAASSEKESRQNLKLAITMDGLPKENYFNIEKQTLAILAPLATTSWQVTHQYNVLDNVLSLKKQAKKNFANDNSSYSTEDQYYLTNYASKLNDYLQAFHDWADIYMQDNPIYNDSKTSAKDKQGLKSEMDQYENDFNRKKQDWLSAYNQIMNLPN